jgi:hypothetical protein
MIVLGSLKFFNLRMKLFKSTTIFYIHNDEAYNMMREILVLFNELPDADHRELFRETLLLRYRLTNLLECKFLRRNSLKIEHLMPLSLWSRDALIFRRKQGSISIDDNYFSRI